MRYRSLTFLIFSTILLFLAYSGFAQTNGKIAASSGAAAVSKPFIAGEVLYYEGKLSKIIQGITVADLTFTVENSSNENDYLIKAEAKSKGTLIKFFRYSFLYQFESTIEGDNFRALKTILHNEEKDRVRDSQAIFDYKEKKVTFTQTNPKEPMSPPRKIASEISEKTHDLISGIYAMRLLPLEVGKTFELTISDSGLVYKIPVRVTARERQKTIFGKVMCFRVEPEVFGENRMIENKGSMIIWITDDKSRIPVRSQINANIGKIEIKLKKAENKSGSTAKK